MMATACPPGDGSRLAVQNAGSIASLILTVDCVVAEAPKKDAERAGGLAAAREME